MATAAFAPCMGATPVQGAHPCLQSAAAPQRQAAVAMFIRLALFIICADLWGALVEG